MTYPLVKPSPGGSKAGPEKEVESSYFDFLLTAARRWPAANCPLMN